MIIPNLRMKWISDEKGYGLFATQQIPKGTITFIQDSLDIVISKRQFLRTPELLKASIEKYSYLLPDGDRIISWDLGKYMNHCCQANTLTTGYGFEIAIRDISAGEEVTDDYRIFSKNFKSNVFSCPNKSDCNQPLIPTESAVASWDEKILPAIINVFEVDQPLIAFLDSTVLAELKMLSRGQTTYKSVKEQAVEYERIDPSA